MILRAIPSERPLRWLARLVLAGMLVWAGCDDNCDCDEPNEPGICRFRDDNECQVPRPNAMCTYNISYVEITSYKSEFLSNPNNNNMPVLMDCRPDMKVAGFIQVMGDPARPLLWISACDRSSPPQVTAKFTGTQIPCYP
jgi:hypothetical protein